MARWYVIEIKYPGRCAEFIGRVRTTENEIRDQLGPYVFIAGNLVTVYGRPAFAKEAL